MGGDVVRVPLAPVGAPEPTVFPSGLPTASIPMVRAHTYAWPALASGPAQSSGRTVDSPG